MLQESDKGETIIFSCVATAKPAKLRLKMPSAWSHRCLWLNSVDHKTNRNEHEKESFSVKGDRQETQRDGKLGVEEWSVYDVSLCGKNTLNWLKEHSSTFATE